MTDEELYRHALEVLNRELVSSPSDRFFSMRPCGCLGPRCPVDPSSVGQVYLPSRDPRLAETIAARNGVCRDFERTRVVHRAKPVCSARVELTVRGFFPED